MEETEGQGTKGDKWNGREEKGVEGRRREQERSSRDGMTEDKKSNLGMQK